MKKNHTKKGKQEKQRQIFSSYGLLGTHPTDTENKTSI